MKFTRILLLPFLFIGFSVFAATPENNVQLGIYTSIITYTEPSVMEEEGSLFGFIGRFSSHKNGDFLSLEASYASGYMDYEGSGTIEDIPDEMLEIRGLIGRDLKISSNYRMTPYIGLGYRNLNDDSSGMVSSTLRYGYEREQIYLYVPFGLEFKRASLAGGGWTLSGRIEFDYLLEGKNKSYTSVGGSDHNDLSFTQSEGYGNRISIGFTRTFGTGRAIIIEPFYKHWDIARSTVDYDGDTPMVEPYNYSREMGIALLLTI
ncbi:autotransporter domain-containing protein [Marinomonas transparens]|nr:autotransporter domain-containing protein [Marinomonas transparens]